MSAEEARSISTVGNVASRYNVPMKYSLRSLVTFSIRDLLWLMVVAAILTAWWLDHRRLTTPPPKPATGGLHDSS